MRIGINARFLIKNKMEGIGVFTFEVCKRLAKLMPEHTFYFYFDRDFDADFITQKNIVAKKILPSARHPFLWKLWFDVLLPYHLKKDKIDVFFSADGYCSLNTKVPQILTIHDIAFEHFPQYIPFLHAKYMQYYTPKYIEKAKKIITVSEFSKQDLIQKYGVENNKIEIVYNGFSDSEATSNHIKYNIEQKYFIFVGAIHPRKNVLNLVRAFEVFKQQKTSDFKLVLVGRDAWMNNDFKTALKNSAFHQDIIWIKEIDRNNLLHLMKNAFALTYFSQFEGFGIPLIEAMEFGVPILASNVSAIPEIAGNAALYCEPNNVEQIANQMKVLTENEILYQSLKAKSLERKNSFSWDKSAKKVADIIVSLINNS